MAENDIARIAAQADLPAIASNFTTVKAKGKEYVATCVFHSPDKNPSLSLFQKNGKWQFKCFSCGEGGDAIDWFEKLEGLDTAAAIKRLNGDSNWEPRFKAPPKTTPIPDRITSKPPAGTPAPNFSHRDHGEPVRIWPYRDVDGDVLGYVARYEVNGKKEILPWTWGARADAAPAWGCGQFNKPRPLYNLHQLADRPNDPVLLVEGEKTADAASQLLPQYIAVTWPGGANAWRKADFSSLKTRSIVMWPDNDQPGIECMEQLAAVIVDPRGLACQIKLVDPNRQPEGWDLADALAEGWTTDQTIAWAKQRAKVWGKQPDSALEPQPEPATPLEAYAGDPPSGDEPDDALPASMSEDMLADRFAEEHAPRWRFVKPWGTWFEWREDGWYRDETAKVDRLAVETTRKAIYWPEAAALTPEGKRRVNSRRTAGSVRDLALSDRRIAARVDQWDTNPMLLGVPGGVVELETGRLVQAKPEHYITKRTLVSPAAGDAPIWRQFLETVTGEDAELIAFLQRFGGYTLTGQTREQCLAFLYGTGQNGKGVFITTLSRILGDYAVSADADVFMESDHQRHPTEMARLRGARLVYVDETDGTKRWNEKRIKRVTGGGKIEAHFMRQDDFEFEPQFKLLIAGNHKPQLRGVGKAMQRRIHLVPFTVTIPDGSRDDKLAQKLEAEYPQILAWFVAGCSAWQAQGLAAPTKVTDATSRYIEGEDIIGEWLEERTEQAGEVSRPIAYKNYRGWVEARSERAWSSKAFWAALEERGYQLRKSAGTWFIQGLAMRLLGHDAEPRGIDY